jgi:hypothetical protein
MKDQNEIKSVNSEELDQVNGGFSSGIPVPRNPVSIEPVKPPVYFTQAIGEDGNFPPEYYW